MDRTGTVPGETTLRKSYVVIHRKVTALYVAARQSSLVVATASKVRQGRWIVDMSNLRCAPISWSDRIVSIADFSRTLLLGVGRFSGRPCILSLIDHGFQLTKFGYPS